MSRLRRIAAVLVLTGITTGSGLTAVAATAAPASLAGAEVAGRVGGHTYVLLGPSVFGVTVQQDPLAYEAIRLTDGTVQGHWTYRYYEGGVLTSYSGPVTCLTVRGNRAWVGRPITVSSDPAQVGLGAWWQVADLGAGRHPVIPDRSTFAGIGNLAQTQAYCDNAPEPHFIFDVQQGYVRVEDTSAG